MNNLEPLAGKGYSRHSSKLLQHPSCWRPLRLCNALTLFSRGLTALSQVSGGAPESSKIYMCDAVSYLNKRSCDNCTTANARGNLEDYPAAIPKP